VGDSTCAHSITDEIYCGARLQTLCTVLIVGFDGMVLCLVGMAIILLVAVRFCVTVTFLLAQIVLISDEESIQQCIATSLSSSRD